MPLDHGALQWSSKPVTRKQGVQILERDQFRCRYCGLDGAASFENALVMGVDFVIARARKGKNNPENLVACCRPCNVIKGSRLFSSFERAKAYVLKRREVLHNAWESHTDSAPKKKSSKKRGKPAIAAAADKDEFEFAKPEIWDEDDFLVELGGEG